MEENEIALMAHLMRRAAFGASYDELEVRASTGYETTVEELLKWEEQPEIETDVLIRYFPDWLFLGGLEPNQDYWMYRIINTQRPLQEKMALFWHGILCTGHSKCENGRQMQIYADMLREHGVGSFQVMLLELSKDPAMIFYLDNCISHKDAINENYGRELLELFSMGVGMDGHPNYTEEDVKACARAFTGWTITNAIPRYPYGTYDSQFIFNAGDHDYGEKTFLGETGPWNGDDIIEIIVRQPATARFISRHLYSFFVADEPPVRNWQDTPPRDPEAIQALEEEYFRSGYDIRSVLRVLFNSDFFKNARFAKVKSPVDAVASTMRMTGGMSFPRPSILTMANEATYMGQSLLNPPSVEGWDTGEAWMDSGTLVERINFTAEHLGDLGHPGVRAMVDRLKNQGPAISPEALVDGCLKLVGHYQLPTTTRRHIMEHLQREGPVDTGDQDFPQRVSDVFKLIAATQEYQLA